MKVSIQTLGSLGDVIPYISLGLSLKARGVDVAILAPRDFSGIIESYGLEASETSSLRLSDWMDKAAKRGTLGNPIALLRDWKTMISPHIDDTMDHCLAAGEGADMIVANLVCAPARVAAEALRIPLILTAQQSVLSPTREQPCAMVWRSWHRKLFNRWGFSFVNLSNRIIGRAMERHRARLGVTGQPAFSDLRTHLDAPLPKITSVPWPIMLERPTDWGDADYLTCYPSLPSVPGRALSVTTQTFLQAGPPPVFIGLGSLSKAHGETLIRAAISALAEVGLRGIVAGGLVGEMSDIPRSVLIAGHEPHDILFPQCAAIVHHGGAGTSDTCLRAGVPQILQPHFLDQFWYADKLSKLGVAPKALPNKAMSGSRLAEALRLAMSPDISMRAAELGEAARTKSGAADLADLILSLAADVA